MSNVGCRSLRTPSATSLSSSPADATGLDELLLLETVIEGALRMLLRCCAAFRRYKLGLKGHELRAEGALQGPEA